MNSEARQALTQIREYITRFQVCISAGRNHTVGLKTNGTVIAVGSQKRYNALTSKDEYTGQCDTLKWRNIIAVAAGDNHTVGLKADGTVVAAGYDGNGQCNTKEWRNIIAVAAGDNHTVGLKANGTVVAVGLNGNGQCNTKEWRNIIAVAARDNITVGLITDGTVVAVGGNKFMQYRSIEEWRDIVSVSVGAGAVGLKMDGTVRGLWGENVGKYSSKDWTDIVTNIWRDLVAISSVFGLKPDGSVVTAYGNTIDGRDTRDWRNIVAISAGDYHLIGLNANGSVVAVGDNRDGQCNTQDWQDIGAVVDNPRQAVTWSKKGRCMYCGGELSGIFRKKCSLCSKSRTICKSQQHIIELQDKYRESFAAPTVPFPKQSGPICPNCQQGLRLTSDGRFQCASHGIFSHICPHCHEGSLLFSKPDETAMGISITLRCTKCGNILRCPNCHKGYLRLTVFGLQCSDLDCQYEHEKFPSRLISYTPPSQKTQRDVCPFCGERSISYTSAPNFTMICTNQKCAFYGRLP